MNFLSDHRPILLQLTRNYNFLPNKIIKDTKVCELKHKPTRSIWKNSLGKDFALQLSLETNKVFHVTLGNESDTNFKSEIEHTLGKIQNPVETDVFKTSSGYLEKVPTSYNQSRCRHDVWKKTSDLQCLEDIWFTSSSRRPIYDILKTSHLRRLQDVWFTTSWRRLIYIVLKTFNLGRLENIWFKTTSGCLIYDVFKTSHLCRLKDVKFTTSWRRLIYDVLRTSDLWRLEDVCKTTSV